MQDQLDKTHRDAAHDDENHRREHRQRTLKHARAVLSENTVIDCKLRDATEDGAHLIFGSVVSLPETFRLHNTSDATIAPVELKWQRGLEAGIAFTGPAEPFHTLKP